MTDKTETMETGVAEQSEQATAEVAPAKKRKTHRLKQRFQVVRKLGQGTYGKVQLAINNETGQEVAIKTIKKSKVDNDQDLVRIRREIQIMSSIHHPHITHIYEVFENKDKIVLVMQYVSGGELYDYVSYKKALSDSEARRIFRQIATAIYYCHKNKICHRDLKLENILLDEKGNAKIADFGLSNVFDDRHFLQTFCGSPLYASPEIVRGMPYFGPEVDCWSLGVLLYTLVYGAMPFDGSNFKKLVKQISESKYFEPEEKSPATDLIRKLLLADAKERATIVDICKDDWVNIDYEHSLLQVAEDLSNLTPVRIDLLLSLAPTTPTETKAINFDNKQTDNDDTQPEINQTEASKRSVGNLASSTDVVTSEKKKAKTSLTKEEIATPEVGDKTPSEEGKTLEQSTQEEQNQEDGKLEGSSSKEMSPKRPGRLSIPKIWDAIQDKPEQTSPPDKKTSPLDKKTPPPFIPTSLKVAEARKALEQKCTTDKKDASKRRDSMSTLSELDKTKRTRDLKKYTTRSISLNLKTDTDQKNVAKTEAEMIKTDENEKSLAKQILKKNIAKAQLMEKRQLSNMSNDSDTVPIMSIDNSSVSTIHNVVAKTESKSEKVVEKSEPLKISLQPTNASPISRSYKKVTFTKEGACITESGKVVTHEGKDGTRTTIEKKSKVTHMVSGDGADRVSLQRSDSQSSTGSTDIFDDIFDDHWTDNVFSKSIFSKSIFSDMFDRPRLMEQKTLRSRPESIERSENDFLSSRSKIKSVFDDDNGKDDFGSDIFNRSRQFLSNFNRLRLDDSFASFKQNTALDSFPKSRIIRESSLNRESSFFTSSSSKLFRGEESSSREDVSAFDRVKHCFRSEGVGTGSDQFENNYATMGPRNFRRFTKQINASSSSSSSFCDKFESTKEFSNSSGNLIKTRSTDDPNTPVVIPQHSEIELNVSLSNSDCKNAIKIAEQSSLLEQLRKFGYKKLVDRRVSESSSGENIAETSGTSKSVLESCSSQSKREDIEKSINSTIYRIKHLDTDAEAEPTAAPEIRQSSSEFQRTSNFETSEAGNNESVEERIRRKSYYSRFNEDSRSCRQRRRSITRFSNELKSDVLGSNSSTLLGDNEHWTMARSSSSSRPAFQSFTSLDSERPLSVSRVSSSSYQYKQSSSFQTYKGSKTSNSGMLNLSADKNNTEDANNGGRKTHNTNN